MFGAGGHLHVVSWAEAESRGKILCMRTVEAYSFVPEQTAVRGSGPPTGDTSC